ncbi:MAG: N-acetyl-alpha-D-glucosaminyl L-malate synthase BshA [Acidobacteria bacterium]|nr:N-acetyl-alpha-D-glucosaminyl L-malate synthase BshA [Acidobacteriota bacterium]
MRIGICCFPSFGGSGVVASELALALAEGGDTVHVVSSTRPPRLLQAPGVHHHAVDGAGVLEYGLFDHPPYTLALANRLAQVVRDAGLDVLHVHYAAPHAVAALLARQMLADDPAGSPACPVVTTVHGTDVTLVGADPNYRDIVGWALRGSDLVTAPSHALRREVAERFSLEEPLEVIPNFLPPAASETSHPAPAGDLQIVHVSNFRPVKRVVDVVGAFARVRRRLPARLCLVGDGPDRAAVERRCRDLGIEEHVAFLGNQARVEPILEQSDLFLSASESESFGLAALEALALGVPVVATRTGGVPEVVCDERNGLLCGVGDTEALADSCVSLLSDPSRRLAFAVHGRQWARSSRFDRGRVVARYREAYRATLTPGGVAAAQAERALGGLPEDPLQGKVEA